VTLRLTTSSDRFVVFLLALSLSGTIVATAQNPPINWMAGGHTAGINAVTLTSDGLLWTAAGDFSLKRWNPASLSLLNSVGLDYTSGTAAFSRNGQNVAVVGPGGVGVFQLSTGSLISSFPGGGWGAISPAISADGQTIIYEQANPTTNFLVEASLATGRTRSITGTSWGFGLYGITPDAGLIVVRDNPSGTFTGVYNIFKGSDGTFVRALSGNLGTSVLAFSPDSKLLAMGNAGGAGTIRIWNLNLFLAIQTIMVQNADGTPATIKSLAFSSDGQLLATGDGSAA
jgi:WD40 repeat protein